MSIRPAIIGNWKMNGSGKDVKLVRRFAHFLDKQKIVGRLIRIPKLSDVPYPVQMEPNLVVEFYSR